MNTIAWIAVYLVGYVVSYLYVRNIMSDEWTVKRRTVAMILCLLSWGVFIVSFVMGFWHILIENLKNESKAKW